MNLTSDEMLDLLSSKGRPHLMRHDDGTWSASVQFPAPVGVTAKVSSGFGHATHRIALAALITRVEGLTPAPGTASKAALARIGDHA